jgi:phosphoglycolate phosphatase
VALLPLFLINSDILMKNKTTIVWDWNGTLLNDVRMCVDAINVLLGGRHLPLLDLTRYRDIFTFPVIDYYRAAGFDFAQEPFEKPAMEFIDLYHQKLAEAGLFADVVAVLDYFKKRGKQQVILSAMEQDSLLKTLDVHRISPYFEHVYGLQDHYAHGKIALGEDLIKKLDRPLNEMIFVGDTLHDREVADHLGIDVVLVCNGHQSRTRLKESGAQVVSSLTELLALKMG